MAADYSRIHRLLRILTLIQGRGDWTAQRLADECGMSVRTMYRDLRVLQEAGIPFSFDDETRGYRVRRDFFMPPVELTLDESLALLALAEHIGGRQQVPLTRPAGRAMAKIRSRLPLNVRAELDELEKYIGVSLARSGPREGYEDVYETIREAIRRRRVLACRYESARSSLAAGPADPGASGEPFHFHPYALFFNQRAWYVIGFHEARGEVRSLKLNRFTSCAASSLKAVIPTEFSLEAHFGHAWRMIRGGTRYEVEISFDASFAETIADTHWHPTQEIDWRADGSITFRCSVDGLDEIVWWVLGMGPHCRVIAPLELAERVRALASDTASRYAVDGTTTGKKRTRRAAT